MKIIELLIFKNYNINKYYYNINKYYYNINKFY